MPRLLSPIFLLRLVSTSAVLLFFIAAETFAQSSDVRFPTLVSANEIADSIPARDLGDARLTDYFYTFTGLPGDLLITVESKNLNGDIDVFTAGELRPLLKITFYAEGPTSSTKNIYLRKRESLILRVEARTPNDDPGTYRIRFSGSFEPISGTLVAESDKPPESTRESARTSDRKSTRVSSSGARIEEPAPEVAAAPTPVATPGPEPEKTATSESSGNTTTRTSRSRRPPPRRTARKPPPADTPKDTENDRDKDSGRSTEATTNKPSEAETSDASAANAGTAGEEARTKPESSRKKPAPPRAASGRAVRRTPTPKPARESDARLVIEERDGTRREFLMSNVRKVTVENGEIVVVANDGYVERISMTTVARMSIGP